MAENHEVKTKRKVWTSNADKKTNTPPSLWCLDLHGTNLECILKTKYIWIVLKQTGMYHVEVFENTTQHMTKTVCKSLISAKRWVTQNLLIDSV